MSFANLKRNRDQISKLISAADAAGAGGGKKNYGDDLVSVTTTSLYGKTQKGGLSQYDNLKY